jgi:hypothetical protein
MKEPLLKTNSKKKIKKMIILTPPLLLWKSKGVLKLEIITVCIILLHNCGKLLFISEKMNKLPEKVAKRLDLKHNWYICTYISAKDLLVGKK